MEYASVNYGDVPTWIAAIAALLTFGVAGVAAWAAFKQVREARNLREEQAKPFVVVDFEPNTAAPPYMELVIKNIGQTLATDVRIEFHPDLESTMESASMTPLRDSPIFREGIPSMPPGREYRMIFENMVKRYERADMPRRYDVLVRYEGIEGRKEELAQVLDLNIYYGYSTITIHGIHHIAKTLRAMAKKVGITSF